MTDRFEQFLRRGFAHRILGVDEPAALSFAAGKCADRQES